MDKIKAYPLIYSGTKFVDYVNGGIVRPHNIDTEKASEYMMASMHRIEYLDNGIRYCVFRTGEYIIYGGTACIPHKLVKRIKQIEKKELDLDYEDYLTDKFGRPMIFFIGFAVKASDFPKGKTIKLSLFETYKKYIEFLKDQWNSPTTKAKLLSENDGIELELVDYKDSFNIGKTSSYEKLNFIENFDEDKYESYINYFFTEMINNPSKDLSFLSNVFPNDVTADYPFKNISLCKGTPEECINYIESSKKKFDIPKEENINSSNPGHDKPRNQTEGQVRRPESNYNDYEKKNIGFMIKWGIILLIAIIGVIILFVVSAKEVKKPVNTPEPIEPQSTETQTSKEVILTENRNETKEIPNIPENPKPKEVPDNQIIM